MNAFIQTVKSAVIKKKPHDGTFRSPRRTLTVVETTRFAAKRHTMICCGLNKMKYCLLQCLTALSSFWFHVFFSTLYLTCQFKHSQFLHESAVETHPCRKPARPFRSFCSLSFSAHLKLQPLPSMYS